MLGLPSALVGVAPDHERVTSGETPGTAAFADGHALLVAPSPPTAGTPTAAWCSA
ncbi:hypothetical protein [Amycolatopsis sp. WQ 127309]|uniref:hypothetical protein n=1 Tax=Amycolatopsis sp. WQ 127309 TaxID=2932773 RepID=UPI0035301AE9